MKLVNILYPYSNYSVYFETNNTDTVIKQNIKRKQNIPPPKVIFLPFPVLKNLYSHPSIKN